MNIILSIAAALIISLVIIMALCLGVFKYLELTKTKIKIN